GIGLAPEMLTKVFDLFAQADHSLARSRGGLGVGLTMVKNLVERHAGQVAARSDGPGRGSEFVGRLPLGASAGPVPAIILPCRAGPGWLGRPLPTRQRRWDGSNTTGGPTRRVKASSTFGSNPCRPGGPQRNRPQNSSCSASTATHSGRWYGGWTDTRSQKRAR